MMAEQSNDFDIVIIGSGPAGSNAAIQLCQRGFRVALFEKAALPRAKVCAGGLVQRAYQLLPDDLTYPIQATSNTLETRVISKGILLSGKQEQLIHMVDRHHFDFALINYAVERGLTLFSETEVTNIAQSGDSVTVTSTYGITQCRYLILAEGAQSRLANQLWGKQPQLIPGIELDIYPSSATAEQYAGKAVFDLDAIDNGYGWVFDKGDHLSVGLAYYGSEKVNLNQVLNRYCTSLKLGEHRAKNKRGFAIPVCPRPLPHMQTRTMVIGDAAGLADPLTAEGLTYAFRSGIAAAEAIAEHFSSPPQVAAAYHNKIADSVLAELAVARRFFPLTYRITWLRNWLFQRYGQLLQRSMVAVISGKRSFSSAKTPWRLAKYLFNKQPSSEHRGR